jgi:hypothetical protein
MARRAAKDQVVPLCDVRGQTPPALPPGISVERARAVLVTRSKWVNGTVLHFYLFGKGPWAGPKKQCDAVRTAFKEWKDQGIGLSFEEVGEPSEAEVRVGFLQTDGSWSYIGRDVLGIAAMDRTMNFGWDLTTTYGRTTALHEIGHTLGMPHEHQNPFAGIVWDEDRVYAIFSGPPNNWSRDKIFRNILQKLEPQQVEGSDWDPDSVMEYQFPAGVIKQPAKYQAGLVPAGGLSAEDVQWAVKWYPALTAEPPTLQPFVSQPLTLKPTEQKDFSILPSESRKYEIRTLGAADTVMALFEEVDGKLRFLAGDDDSGEDRNALIQVKLFKGRRYVVRLRLYYSWGSGQTAVVYS